jgi:DNA-binding transcriptional ArsR family regulator
VLETTGEAYPANSSAATELSGLYGCLVGTDFAAAGRLLSSPARAAMLEVLLDGGTASASELAAAAAVKPSTASGHLAALVEGGMVEVSARGRHRDYRLANREVGVALEALSRICPERPVRSLKAGRTMDALRVARTCYDHLAGQLGVEMLDAMLERKWLVLRAAGYVVPEAGERMLNGIGVDVDDARRQRRTFARPCLDWTERRPHLAGALGAALCRSVIAAGWARRRSEGRGLLLTAVGTSQLHDVLGIALSVEG